MLKRDQYWDTLKFVLIFLVVYGHTVSASAQDGSINKAIYNFIFTFHMPLFIFISGRFSHIKDRTKFKRSIFRLFETYLIFQFIRSFVSLLLGDSISFHSVLSFLFIPQYTLWFLLCLIFWRLLVLFVPQRVLNSPFTVLATCFAISILGGFVPFSVLSIQRVMTFLPFFFCGYYSTEIDTRNYLNKINLGIPIFTILAVFLFIFFYLNTEIGFVLYGDSSYWSHPSLSAIFLCMARCLMLLFASILGVMVMRLIRVQPFLAKLGEATLFIYIYHSFIVQGIRVSVKQNYLSGNEISLLAYAVVITLVLANLSRIKFFNILLNPISFYKNRYL